MLVSDAHLILPTLFLSLVSLSKSVLLMEYDNASYYTCHNCWVFQMVTVLAVNGEV